MMVLGYHTDFDLYITVVIIVLAFPISYYSYQYLRIETRPLKSFRSISILPSVNHTNEEVKKLIDSKKFK